MFNLIYFILGFYLITLVVTILKEFYLKFKSTRTKEKQHLLKKFSSKSKNEVSEKHHIFILKRNKKEISDEDIILNQIVKSKEKRYLAFQNSKYKCEECGNIANLDVYMRDGREDDNEEAIVLCKKCYEKCMTEFKLHYN